MINGDFKLKKTIISLVKIPDLIISQVYLNFFQEKNSLIIFALHGLFQNEEEIKQKIVDPQTWLTVDQFSQFIEHYKSHNYTFVSPDDILNGLSSDKKYAMITFDDGYYNNKHALPFLKKYHIPAVFFISSDNIKENKCFWWDVLYRERIKSKKTLGHIKKEKNQLKLKTNAEIEKYLKDIFGKKSFLPKSDIDRPFNVSELKDFSNEKYVFLGNHTSSHGILTNYTPNKIKSQIINAQNDIQDITGINPISISYPDGKYSDKVIKIAKENGIKIGLTMDYRKNCLPLDSHSSNLMHLGRFDLSGSGNFKRQCELFRSDILLYAYVCNLLNKNKKRLLH